ncbi:glycine cleavage system protein H [Candidatus Woesearchaeota archaeon]|nr:glycine cleavage system protein GcvH [Candidatus Woesearchaeota archaeon]RLE42987.1 MAG: glycine cleavage system protein H [Candidatus Woesearchaeota archaeon]
MDEELPKGLLYNDNHSWVKVNGDVVEVGITKPFANSVKEFVYIELPEQGKEIKKGETYVSMESVKWSGHLESPVSGEIVEVNNALFDEPSLLNQDPYKHWIMRVKLLDKDELNGLMDADQALANLSCKLG